MTEPKVLSGRYEIRALLGRGGMAEVHEGVDNRLGRRVAIKLLRSDLARDPSFHTRLKREAQSAAGLNHPGIVSVYDSGEEEFVESGGSSVSVPFIVMEYVEGQTLREVLNEHGTLTVDEALNVIAGVLAPLEYSHRNGIVHRDIKPANVMLTPEGDIKVMDFGIARALKDNSGLTQTQSVVGTAQYLSPNRPAARSSTPVPTSIRPRACSMSCWPAGPHSSAIRSWPWPISTSGRPRSRRASTTRTFPRPSIGSSSMRCSRTVTPATRTPSRSVRTSSPPATAAR
jgi:serine/threonine protein kinase